MSRPSDFAGNGFEQQQSDEDPVRSTPLNAIEWLRWAWRQLTSMRTALYLLLMLALAAVPGSLIPQNSADPNGVTQWKAAYPAWVGVVDALQGFDVYTSYWFSAIYLLLFISLVGCVLPRLRHHVKALRTAPPRTPAKLERLPAYAIRASEADLDVEATLTEAERLLRARRYRVQRYGSSVSAERGYLRETGNLVFHFALVGILVAVFVGSGLSYTGQRVVVVGQSFVNDIASYDSFTPGRYVTESSLDPYSLRLTDFTVAYEHRNLNALGQPLDYTASVDASSNGGAPVKRTIKVNDPLAIGGTQVYLLGNGYAPHLTVRDAHGRIAFSDYVPFLPQDAKLTSLGIIKVPDSSPKQIGMIGFLYPTVVRMNTGAYTSLLPQLGDPLVSLNVYTGDLGLDSGTPRNAYVLNTSHLTQIAGPPTKTPAVQLKVGQTTKLAGGVGTVRLDRIARFASLEVHHDPSQNWVALFTALAVAGLFTSLLVPRRRLWVRVEDVKERGTSLTYAGLARGDDPGLQRAVDELADSHRLTGAGSEPAHL